MEHVLRWFDPEEPERRLHPQHLAHEELVAPPDLVPRLQRQHDDLVRTVAHLGVLDGHRVPGERVQAAADVARSHPQPGIVGVAHPQERPAQRGADERRQPVGDERSPTVVHVDEPVAAAGEVLGHQLARLPSRRAALVQAAGRLGEHDPPPRLFGAVAEVGLLAVEPVPLVEPAERLERGAAHEEAGADDEPARPAPSAADAARAPRPTTRRRTGYGHCDRWGCPSGWRS